MSEIVEGMYVRVPIDYEHPTAPRNYIMGQVAKIDHDNNAAIVYFHDPFNYRQYFDSIPQMTNPLPMDLLEHCHIFFGSLVKVGKRRAHVIERKTQENGKFLYYLRDADTQQIYTRDESLLEAPFNTGDADPVKQLKRYEFQNPCWYLGRQVVKKTSTILEHFMYGFDILTGCKIFLKAHQMRTVTKCLSKIPCHVMIADEVGLGKTIESLSVIKIYLSDHANQKVLIAVPQPLVEQWCSELLFKFNLVNGTNDNDNYIQVCALETLTNDDLNMHWDFSIVDEVHNALHSQELYRNIHKLSMHSENLIMLSATPIQQRHEEYLKLLRLITPSIYDNMSLSSFEELSAKQENIQRLSSDVLDDIDEIKTDILPDLEEGEDPHENEDLQDELDEIQDTLKQLADIIDDQKLEQMINSVNYAGEDFGLHDVQVIISYACDNYQISRDIIRGRRDVLGVYPTDNAEFSERKLIELTYPINEESNYYEYEAFRSLSEWISSQTWDKEQTRTIVIPLLESFFSSTWAYTAVLSKTQVPEDVLRAAGQWKEDEEEVIDQLDEHMSGGIDDYYTRMAKILAYMKENLQGEKVVIFTNFTETFHKCLEVFQKVLGIDHVAGYAKDFEASAVDIYRFQKDENCQVLICDKTGGEGHNLQNANYIIHYDLPWNVNSIEQRIGRVDRLGRKVSIPVTSIVIHSEDTFEEQLFRFWNQGLDIFEKSLSGLEIIMEETNDKIINAVQSNLEYGLEGMIPQMIENADKMRKAVRKEQIFDTHIMRYDPLYNEIDKILTTYEDNDNDTFAHAMCSWASLAGFHIAHNQENKNIISMGAENFSLNSAKNVLLIPPDWTSYMLREQNAVILRVQQGYENFESNCKRNSDRTIWGTFDRRLAIANDYLHFFAPGDEVFDCIINNAKTSYRGMCCAMGILCNLNWSGFCFSYSVVPNERLLLEHNIPLQMLGEFKQFLPLRMFVTYVPFSDQDKGKERDVAQLMQRVEAIGYHRADTKYIEHLGQRSRNNGFMEIPRRTNMSNIEWFQSQFPEDEWVPLVDDCAKKAQSQVLNSIAKRINRKGARDLIEKKIATREAHNRYYGFEESGDLEQLGKMYELIYQSIDRPILRMESACVLLLVKNK